jgi:hypothetical protein
MAEPSAVRSMRAPRANASGFWLILVILPRFLTGQQMIPGSG